MTRLPLILALIPIPALACDFNGTTVTAEPAPDGLTVTLTNRLVQGWNEDVCALPLDGDAVQVIWSHQPGEKPDFVAIIAPPGYVAEPARVAIPEDATAVVSVRLWSGM